MTRDEIIFNQVDAWIKTSIDKNYSLKPKEKSKFMKFLNFFLRAVNKNFMTGYITTIGSTVYVPSDRFNNLGRLWPVLAHEACHMFRSKKMGSFIHNFLYLFPQVLIFLSLLSLLAIWFSNFWLLNLLWILCLTPLPAYFRYQEEMSGYLMKMCISWWMYEEIPDSILDHIAEKFLTSDYYWTWPFKKAIYKHLEQERQAVQDGQYDNVFPYNGIRKIIEETNNILFLPPRG